MKKSEGVVGLRLLSFIERIERLEEEKKSIADDIKDVKAEAKGVGFDVATINEIIKQRKLSPDQRAEKEALLDLYKASIGMLDGTPLGEAAIKKLSGDKPAKPPEENPDSNGEQTQEDKILPDKSLDDAKAMGAKAASDGVEVTKNPFPARDPRRAAWDEAWCHAKGTDGMDIPDAWKPKKTPKPADGDQ